MQKANRRPVDMPRIAAIRFEIDALVAHGELTLTRMGELLDEGVDAAGDDEEFASFFRGSRAALESRPPRS